MSLTITLAAFPFAPVGPDAVGGAEQIVAQLDAGLNRLGHRTIVICAAGSETVGERIETTLPDGAFDEAARCAVQAAHARNIAGAMRRADLLHLHGLDFEAYLPLPGAPTLVTLHLPASWYPPGTFARARPDTWLVPVSRALHATCPHCDALLPPVPNGVPVEALPVPVSRRGYAIALGRICPEKALHLALDAGTRAKVPVLLCGEVFPYPDHQRYWREEIAPRLAAGPHRFLGPVGFARKRRLLSGARCLLSASLAPETSSLVAMEALACGTPVIAFPSGALPEIVDDCVTGFLVRDVGEMADAIGAARAIDPETCRRVARRRFSAETMVARYLALYQRIAARVPEPEAHASA